MTARIAILFDNAVHPETTGADCLRALESLARDGHIAAVEHVLPGDLPRLAADRGPWDLILAIDDGLTCDLPPGLPPVAWWVIDTWRGLRPQPNTATLATASAIGVVRHCCHSDALSLARLRSGNLNAGVSHSQRRQESGFPSGLPRRERN